MPTNPYGTGFGMPGTATPTFNPQTAFPNRGTQTWSDYFAGAFGDYTGRAGELEGEENRRHGEATGFLRGRLDAFDKDFADQETRLAGQFQTQAGQPLARDLSTALSGLGQSIGSRGIDPNSGAAMAAVSGLGGQYLRGLSDARLGVALSGADRASAHRGASMSFAGSLANMMNQSPSMLGTDAQSNMLELQLARYGIDQDALNQRGLADAQRKAGRQAGFGNIIGSVLGMFG